MLWLTICLNPGLQEENAVTHRGQACIHLMDPSRVLDQRLLHIATLAAAAVITLGRDQQLALQQLQQQHPKCENVGLDGGCDIVSAFASSRSELWCLGGMTAAKCG